MLQRFALSLAAAIALLVLPACEETVTAENFDAITTGMDITEVEAILGGPGELQQASGVGIDASGLPTAQGGEGATKDYMWGDDTAYILVKFKDGKVVYKQKMGL